MCNLKEDHVKGTIGKEKGRQSTERDSSSGDQIFSIDSAEGLEPLSKAQSLSVRAGKGIGTQGAHKLAHCYFHCRDTGEQERTPTFALFD